MSLTYSQISQSLRPPCGGWPNLLKTFLAHCANHLTSSEQTVPQYVNVTKVADWSALADPAGINPYPRLEAHPTNGCVPDPSCSPPSNPPCCDGTTTCWDTSSLVTSPGANTVWQPPNYYGSTFYNVFQSGSVNDKRLCSKIGFKNVQAMKVWHGVPGPTSELWFGYNYAATPAWDHTTEYAGGPNGTCQYADARENPEDTMYRTITTSTSYSDDFGTGTVSATTTVDRYSGIKTNTYSESGPYDHLHGVDPGVTSTTWPRAVDLLNNWSMNIATLCNTYNSYLGYMGYGPATVSGADNVWTLTWTGSVGCLGATVTTFEIILNGNSLTVNQYGNVDGRTGTGYSGCVWGVICGQTWTVSSTKATYSQTTENSGAFAYWNAEFDYSNPYTATEFLSDFYDLMNQWDMADDVQYPLRTDTFATVAPYVTRSEPTSPAIPEPESASAYVDPGPYTGEIIGGPMPHGYNNYFDNKHQTWDHTSCDAFPEDTWYVKSFGATSGQNIAGDSTDGAVPATATQWTNNYQATMFAPYAWLNFQGGVLSGQKWCETIIQRPSYNWARPCEIDRYSVDEASARCITGSSGATFTLSSATTIATGDPVMICGTGTSYDGGWTASLVSAGVYSVSGQFSSGSDLVLNSNGGDNMDCGTGRFGKLRFPTCPAVGGLVGITAVSNNNPVTISLERQSFLRTGDRVTISGSLGATSINGTWTITKIDRSTFTIPLSGSSQYLGCGNVYSPNAPFWGWYDTYSKGQFSVHEAQYNFRDVGERNNLVYTCQQNTASGCSDNGNCGLAEIRAGQATWGVPSVVSAYVTHSSCFTPYTPCKPPTIFSTPNSESLNSNLNYTASQTFAFPNDFLPDLKYGSYWAMWPIQTADDYLWQTPHALCYNNTEWTNGASNVWYEDDGFCEGDGTLDIGGGTIVNVKYFPHRPVVEYVDNYPSYYHSGSLITAPTLPSGSGTYVGVLTLDYLNSYGGSSPPLGNIPNIPAAIGNSLSITLPCHLYLNEAACCLARGRFYNPWYLNEGIICIPPS